MTTQPTYVGFGSVTLGDYSGPKQVELLYLGGPTSTIDLATGVTISGLGADDYVFGPGTCPGNGTTTIVLSPQDHSCLMDARFFAGAVGDRPATARIRDDQGNAATLNLFGTGTVGY